jgi:signal transduction histidine kinase
MPGSPARLYEEDFVRWTEEQAAALREAASSTSNLPLDWENLAEEIDSLGRSLRHELRSRLMVILEHLLKLEYSPAVDPRRGWVEAINRERLIVEDLLQESPSLRTGLDEIIEQAKSRAARLASKSLSNYGEAARIPPLGYTENQILGDWFPGETPLPANGERA